MDTLDILKSIFVYRQGGSFGPSIPLRSILLEWNNIIAFVEYHAVPWKYLKEPNDLIFNQIICYLVVFLNTWNRVSADHLQNYRIFSVKQTNEIKENTLWTPIEYSKLFGANDKIYLRAK